MSKLTDKIAQIARPVVEDEGCSLWDVEYVREAGSWYLRVYIDKDEGVSISDCEVISKAIDPILDEQDFIPDSYIFEVASAGADRELKRPSDFEKFIDHEVEVKTYRQIKGQKLFVGVLKEYSDGNITVLANNQSLVFSKQDVALVRLHVTF